VVASRELYPLDPGEGLRPPSGGRRMPDGMLLPASPQDGLRGRSPRSDAAESRIATSSPGPLGVLAETAPNQAAVGLYVHVPFCTKKCYFCSFNTAPMDDRAMRRYLDALHREIDLVASAPWAPRVHLETVFFGGGTPSLLSGADLTAILDHLRARFVIASGAEVTVESNPESLGGPKLAQYREAGVSRISLGVQALDDAILPAIGRLHDATAARAAFAACRAAGFDDVSVDLMYGLPGLDLDGWTRAIRAVLDWEPDHLSAYGLTLDAGSLWGAGDVSGLPPEDTVVAQYWALAREAEVRGLEHYEVSNYARPGHRSRHNQIYWRRGEYLALGPGACGFVGDVRFANVKPVARYAALLESDVLPIDTSERLTAAQALAERLFLGLRTADGVPREVLETRAAATPALRRRFDAWLADGLMEVDAERIRLTERGFLLSDALFVELI
jgi:oxygen-independent coproporphyrinogen III oxidase